MMDGDLDIEVTPADYGELGVEPFEPLQAEHFRKDPLRAARYLTNAIADGPNHFFLALKDIADVVGMDMTELADAAGLHRVSLYEILVEDGNPGYRTIDKILHALGFTLAVQHLPEDESAPA